MSLFQHFPLSFAPIALIIHVLLFSQLKQGFQNFRVIFPLAGRIFEFGFKVLLGGHSGS